ncbi:MAG TPA: DUF3787 domain-containing protein [Clostridiaceae bacterium]|jgi:hypothetical protein|nr:DUF3787 domain-containing protein [Clostridiaceae bacterium]
MKRKSKGRPIENHNNASWANIEKTKKNSGVTIPSEEQVLNAKQYADDNEK